MAEADLILGAVSLGIEAIKQLHWYCATFRGAADDITHLTAETRNIEATLAHLGHTLSSSSGCAYEGEKEREVVARAAEELRRNFEEIEKIVMPFVRLSKREEGKKGGVKRWDKAALKAKYPGKEKEIKELTARIESCKGTLGMAMDALNLSDSMKIKDGLEYIRDGQVMQMKQITHLRDESRTEFRQLQHVTRVSSGVVTEEIRSVANAHTPILQEIRENLVQVLNRPSPQTMDPERLEKLIVNTMMRYQEQQRTKPLYGQLKETHPNSKEKPVRRNEKVYCNVQFLGGNMRISYVQTSTAWDSGEYVPSKGEFSLSFLAGWLPRAIDARFRTLGEIGFGLKPDVIVSGKSLARICCAKGDLEELQRLIRKGKATARDIIQTEETCNPDRYVYESLLHIAVEAGHYDICSFLIKQGADPYKKLYYEPNTGDIPRYATPLELLNPLAMWEGVYSLFDWESPNIDDAFLGETNLSGFIEALFINNPKSPGVDFVRPIQAYLDTFGWDTDFTVCFHPNPVIICLCGRFASRRISEKVFFEILGLFERFARRHERIWGSNKDDFMTVYCNYLDIFSLRYINLERPPDLVFAELHLFRPDRPDGSYTPFTIPIKFREKIIFHTSYPLFQRFCEVLDVHQEDQYGDTPLFSCLSLFSTQKESFVHGSPMESMPFRIRKLAELGSEMNGLHRRSGYRPLHRAILRMMPTGVLEALLEKGSNPALEDKEGRTPLETALRCGNIIATTVLLRYRHQLSQNQWAVCKTTYHQVLQQFRSYAQLRGGNLRVPKIPVPGYSGQDVWSCFAITKLIWTNTPWDDGCFGTKVSQTIRVLIPELFATLFGPYFEKGAGTGEGEVVYAPLQRQQVEAVEAWFVGDPGLGVVRNWARTLAGNRTTNDTTPMELVDILRSILEEMIVDESRSPQITTGTGYEKTGESQHEIHEKEAQMVNPNEYLGSGDDASSCWKESEVEEVRGQHLVRDESQKSEQVEERNVSLATKDETSNRTGQAWMIHGTLIAALLSTLLVFLVPFLHGA